MKMILNGRWESLRYNIHIFCEKVTNSLQISKPGKQIIALDGLRGFACLSVIFFHLNLFDLWINDPVMPKHGIYTILDPFLDAGQTGLVLFFLLSGFLLFLPFAKSLLFDSTWPSLRRFYLRRFFRILPAYYVALFLMILFFAPKFLHHQFWPDFATFLTFRMGFLLSSQVDTPFWTLAIEFQFYLLLPLIAWLFGLLVKRGSLRWRIIKVVFCLCVMIVWGVATRFWGQYFIAADTTAVDSLIPHRLLNTITTYIYGDTGKFFEVFAIGMSLAILYTYIQNAVTRECWEERLRRLSPWLLIAGFVIIYFLSVMQFYVEHVNVVTHYNATQMYTFLNPYMVSLGHYWPLFYPLGCGISYALCMTAVLYGSAKLRRPFEWPLLRWIGFISFSLYMWHQPFILYFLSSIGSNLSSVGFRLSVEYAVSFIWILAIVFPLALASYRWIEMPGMRLGEYIIRKMDEKSGRRKNNEKQEDVSFASQHVDEKQLVELEGSSHN